LAYWSFRSSIRRSFPVINAPRSLSMMQIEYTICEPSDQVNILVIKDSSSVGVYVDPFSCCAPSFTD
jgi:hypothetical protein